MSLALALVLGVLGTVLVIGFLVVFLEWRERHHADLQDAGLERADAEAALALYDAFQG